MNKFFEIIVCIEFGRNCRVQRFEIGLLLFWYNVLTTNRMNQGKFVFFQLLSLISHRSFLACVKRYKGDYKAKHFSCWKQFLCMAFGQLAHRESLSDTILCLSANEQKLYHPGIGEAVAKSTLSKEMKTGTGEFMLT